MSLREEMERYEKLTGESAEHIPIIKIGAFLDGVDRGIEELEKIKEYANEEIILRDNLYDNVTEYSVSIRDLENIIDRRIAKLKGKNEEEE